MRIESLQIDGFGLFNNKSINGFEKGVNVLYGQNEKGKSTLLDFLRFTLFGYTTYKVDRRPPLNGGNHGGQIQLIHSNGSKLLLYRNGENSVDFSVDGIEANENRYKQLIGGAGKALYDNVYAITLDELVGLHSLEESGMEDRIFSLGMGINADLGQFEKQLKQKAEDLFLPRGSNQRIVSTQNEINAIQNKIKALQGNLTAFNEKTTALKLARKELIAAKNEKEEKTKKIHRIEAYLKSMEAFVQYRRSEKELTKFDDFKPHPKQLLEDYKLQKQRVVDNKETLDKWQNEYLALKKEVERIEIDSTFEGKLQLFEELKLQVGLYASNLKSIDQEKQLLQETKRKIEQGLSDLGGDYTIDEVIALKGLKPLNKVAKEVELELSQLQSDLKRGEDHLVRLEGDYKFETKQGDELKVQLEQSAIKNESELKLKKEKLLQLKTDYDRLLSGAAVQENNLQKVAIWTAAIVLLIAAVMLYSSDHLLVAILSFLIAVFLIASKFMARKSSIDTQFGKNIQQLNQEKEELDAQLSAYTNTKSQLKDAEERQERTSEALRQQKELNKKNSLSLEEVNQRWEKTLEEHDLPKKIKPGNIEGFVNAVGQLQEKYQEMERRKAFIGKKEKEVQSFRNKVLEVEENHSTSVEGVKLLIDKMGEALEKKKNRTQKENQAKQKASEMENLKEKIKSYEGNLTEKIKQIGVKDELSFYEFFEKMEEFDEITRLKNEAIDKIQIHCGSGESLSQALEVFKNRNKTELEDTFHQLQLEVEEVNENISDTDKRIGQLTEQADALLQENELLTLQNKKEVLLVQYEEAVKKWFSYRMAMEVLNESKKAYEKEKQPAVIHHTKRYFQAITNNAYRDLRISLSNKKVAVITDKGKSKSVDELSRGTREQLLLALRMGLIEEYESTVEPLPLALDDVMVNFDNNRAERLAEVLTDFAKNRQVLLFTCHEHSRDIFKNNDAKMLNW